MRSYEHRESDDPEIHYEAVLVAGNWQLDAAWSHIVKLVKDPHSPKSLLLAAIGALGSIRPAEAPEIVVDLAHSDDEGIAEAVDEVMAAAEVLSDEKTTERDGWIH